MVGKHLPFVKPGGGKRLYGAKRRGEPGGINLPLSKKQKIEGRRWKYLRRSNLTETTDLDTLELALAAGDLSVLDLHSADAVALALSVGATGHELHSSLTSGLTLREAFAVGNNALVCSTGGDPAAGAIHRQADAVLSCAFIDLDGSAGGIIWELGGSGNGALCCFRADGSFVVRAGAGAAIPNANTVAIDIASGSAPSGDGVLDVSINWNFSGGGSGLELKVWWNGASLGTHSITTQTQIMGSDNGSYLASTTGGSSYIDEGPDAGLIQGQDYFWASPLYYYYNQLIP